MDTDLSFAQLYADLVEAAAQSPPPEHSFSAAQFAADAGITHKQALDRLRALQARGGIEGDKFIIDGSRQWRFWFPSERRVQIVQ